jgi:hypothetical protein
VYSEQKIKVLGVFNNALDFNNLNLKQLREIAEKEEIEIPPKYIHVDEIQEYLYLRYMYGELGSTFGGIKWLKI